MGERLTPNTLAGLQIKRIEEQPPFFNMLFYGESGVGKTVLAGSASVVPEMSPVLFVDMEGGTASLRATYPDVHTVRVTTWKEMSELYEALFHGGHGYKTVVLDSLSEIQKFSMYDIMMQLMQSAPDRDPDVPSMREWGKNLEQIRRFVRGFRDMPNMHTIFTALAQTEKNTRTGQQTTGPMLTGKMAKEVPAFLDIVGYYYVKDTSNAEGGTDRERLLLTTKTDEYIAKDRSGKLPLVVQSPTMQSLYDLMTAGDKHKVESSTVEADISELVEKEK